MSSQIKYSIIIPSYNEEKSIAKVVSDIRIFLGRIYDNNELIIVNDGSNDDTIRILEKIRSDNIKIVSHPYNKGYGAAIKTGAKVARGESLVIFDADGQHQSTELQKLLEFKDKYDMIVGSRQKYNGPFWRQPGKRLLTLIASYLVDFKISDINSGLRVINRKKFFRFVHLYPNGFSLSTTITLAFLKHGYTVKYVPINVNERQGSSSVNPIDGLRAINLVLRMIMIFSPAKVFLPLAFLLFALTIISFTVDIFIYSFNLSESTMTLFIAFIFIFIIGLLADQIAALRRDMRT